MYSPESGGSGLEGGLQAEIENGVLPAADPNDLHCIGVSIDVAVGFGRKAERGGDGWRLAGKEEVFAAGEIAMEGEFGLRRV